MVSLYLTLAIVLLMVAYAGVENTVRVFGYMDLELRFQYVIVRSYFLRRRLEKELSLPRTSFKEHYKKSYGRKL